jgi:hypothetical protein
VTKTVKIGVGIVGVLLVCLLVGVVVEPHFLRAVTRRIHHWHASRVWRQTADERIGSLPKVVFWAWERPEDLRFLDPQKTGVAFLAKTIYLQPASQILPENPAGRVVVRPRLQPLRIAPGSALIAVVRIETSFGLRRDVYLLDERASLHERESLPQSGPVFTKPLPYTAEQRESVATEIASLQNLPGVRAIQIDFDTTLSEREFYAALLSDVRSKLPASMPLSITALASWCIGDPWIERLPLGTIDEAVPMLFRMGPDAADATSFLHSSNEFPVPACQNSLGLSTDESFSLSILNGSLSTTSPSRDKRIYIFSPRPWTQSSAESILKELQP